MEKRMFAEKRHASILQKYIEHLQCQLYYHRVYWLDAQAKKELMLEVKFSPIMATLKLLHLSQKIAIPRIRRQNKKDDSAGKIDIEKNSMYYSENGTREGFIANCTARTYDGFPEMANCSMYICDGTMWFSSHSKISTSPNKLMDEENLRSQT